MPAARRRSLPEATSASRRDPPQRLERHIRNIHRKKMTGSERELDPGERNVRVVRSSAGWRGHPVRLMRPKTPCKKRATFIPLGEYETNLRAIPSQVAFRIANRNSGRRRERRMNKKEIMNGGAQGRERQGSMQTRSARRTWRVFSGCPTCNHPSSSPRRRMTMTVHEKKSPVQRGNSLNAPTSPHWFTQWLSRNWTKRQRQVESRPGPEDGAEAGNEGGKEGNRSGQPNYKNIHQQIIPQGLTSAFQGRARGAGSGSDRFAAGQGEKIAWETGDEGGQAGRARPGERRSGRNWGTLSMGGGGGSRV